MAGSFLITALIYAFSSPILALCTTIASHAVNGSGHATTFVVDKISYLFVNILFPILSRAPSYLH